MKQDQTINVFKNVIRFSLPFLLSCFLQTLYGMADLFIIGQFNGVSSTTAVSVGSQIMHMLTVMIVGLAMGATVLIGHAVGSGKPKQAARTIGCSVTIFLSVSLLLAAGMLFAVKPIVRLMSVPNAAIPGTIAYLTICFMGIPSIAAYNILSAVFRGLGDSKSPMYFIAIACGANIALDYLFIGWLRMGAAGAALGTTLAQTISVLAALAVCRSKDSGIALTAKDFYPRKEIMYGLLRIGIPVALQEGFIQISFLIITVIANGRGLADAAAVGIVEKLIGVMFLIPSTMLSTVSALASQDVGAARHGCARLTLRCAVLIAVGWGLSAALLMQLAAGVFVSMFIDRTDAGSAEVVRLGAGYLRASGTVFLRGSISASAAISAHMGYP